MAKRFGGQHSPSPERPLAGREIGQRPPAPVKHRLEGRPFWITLAAAPFLLAAFGDGVTGLVRALGAFALIAASAMLTREGLRAEAAFDTRRVARKPAFPRKIFGAALFGLGIGIGAQAPEMGLTGAIALGAVGALLHLLAFGLDPMRSKGMEGIDTFQQDRVLRIVAEGEKHLVAMREAILRTGDHALLARIDRFAASAREMFRVVEEDPGDLTSARRYMGVYLMGARDASVKFADVWTQSREASARAAYEALLDDMEANYTARTRALLADGREGLDIEIDVLRDRLAREGLAMAPVNRKD